MSSRGRVSSRTFTTCLPRLAGTMRHLIADILKSVRMAIQSCRLEAICATSRREETAIRIQQTLLTLQGLSPCWKVSDGLALFWQQFQMQRIMSVRNLLQVANPAASRSKEMLGRQPCSWLHIAGWLTGVCQWHIHLTSKGLQQF